MSGIRVVDQSFDALYLDFMDDENGLVITDKSGTYHFSPHSARDIAEFCMAIWVRHARTMRFAKEDE
jgi:hypothetical protein